VSQNATNVTTAYSQKDVERLRRSQIHFDAGDYTAATGVIEEHLLHNPNDPQGLVMAALILKKAGRLPFAYSLAKRAAELMPQHPEPHSALGLMAQGLWQLDEAEKEYRLALARAKNPKQRALYLNNLSSIRLDTGRFKEGIPILEESLSLVPDDAMARHNYGLCLLAERQWQKGWEYYSSSIGSTSRLNIKYLPDPGEPVWDGTKGKTVVITGEQGLGDELCAASMIPDAIEDCQKVIIDCDKRLTGLFKRSFPKASVHGTRWEKGLAWPDEDRQIDYSIAGFELGQFYRNSDEAFPGTPYLTPCPQRTAMWKSYFASLDKPTIGIAWSGGTWANAGMHRKMDLPDWKPIFDSIDAHWVSLQYKDAKEEIAGTPVVQYPWATLTKDYDDTAALAAACDLIITMQTSVVHLAGAMGVPTWSIIPKTSQWRYGESGESLPWYRSVRMFRQGKDWPVKQIASELKQRYRVVT
jgi:tetratricopeptide (TPR) repeat protein